MSEKEILFWIVGFPVITIVACVGTYIIETIKAKRRWRRWDDI